MSFTRLVVKLGKAGFDPNRLEQLERADLLEAMAKTMLAEPTVESKTDLFREAREASQIPLPAGDSSSATSDGSSAAVRLRKLELKEKRAKREERKTARDAEAQKLALQAKAQRLTLEVEKKRAAGDEGETARTGDNGSPGAGRAGRPSKDRAAQVRARDLSGGAEGPSSQAR